MTREELANLSFNDLVEQILNFQITVTQLQARIAELELHASREPAPASLRASERAAARMALASSSAAPPRSITLDHPASAVAPRPILTTHDLNTIHTRRSARRRRSVWNRLQSRLFPKTAVARRYVVIALLVVIVLSVTASFVLPVFFPSGLIRVR